MKKLIYFYFIIFSPLSFAISNGLDYEIGSQCRPVLKNMLGQSEFQIIREKPANSGNTKVMRKVKFEISGGELYLKGPNVNENAAKEAKLQNKYVDPNTLKLTLKSIQNKGFTVNQNMESKDHCRIIYWNGFETIYREVSLQGKDLLLPGIDMNLVFSPIDRIPTSFMTKEEELTIDGEEAILPKGFDLNPTQFENL